MYLFISHAMLKAGHAAELLPHSTFVSSFESFNPFITSSSPRSSFPVGLVAGLQCIYKMADQNAPSNGDGARQVSGESEGGTHTIFHGAALSSLKPLM